MPINPTSSALPPLQEGMQCQQAKDTKCTASYSRQDLPNIDSDDEYLKPILQMGESFTASQSILSADQVSPISQQIGMTSEQTVRVLESSSRNLDEIISKQLAEAPSQTACALVQQVLAVEALVKGDFSLAQRAATNTDTAVMTEHLVEHFNHNNPQSQLGRAKILLNYYGTVLGNKYESDAARWAANIHNVVLRDLATVGLITTLRQLVGMALESRFILDDLAPTTLQQISVSVMLLGPCLNILGATRDEINGTATNTSRLARGTMFGFSLIALCAAVAIKPPVPLSQLAASVTQAATYTVLRDLVQLFIPLQDNTTSQSLSATAIAGFGYSGIQVLTNLLSDTLSLHSGISYPMGIARAIKSVNGARAEIVSAIKSLPLQLGDDVISGLLNTLAEVGDDLLRPSLIRRSELQRPITSIQNKAIADEGRDPREAMNHIQDKQREGLRIYFGGLRLPIVGCGLPTREQLLNQMLTNNAMRTSFLHTILSSMLTIGALLSDVLSPTQGTLASYCTLATTTQIGYIPYVLVNEKQAASPAALNKKHSGDDSSGTPEQDTSDLIHIASYDNNVLEITKL